MLVLSLCVLARSQSTILYRAFNPLADTCTDDASVIIYQNHPSFTQGTYKCVGGVYVALNLISGSITSLNGLSGTAQTFATGTSGTDFNISSLVTTHTFNIPDASVLNRGLVTTGTQTFSGTKSFAGITLFNPIGSGTATQFLDNAGNTSFAFNALSPDLRIANGRGFTWSSTDQATGSSDVGLHRSSAGVLEINSSTVGDFRDLSLRLIDADTFEFSTGSLFRPIVGSNGACFGNSVGKLDCTSLLDTDGKLLIGQTGGVPLTNTISGTSPIVITNGPGTIAVSCPTCSTTTNAGQRFIMNAHNPTTLAAGVTKWTYPQNFNSAADPWEALERTYIIPANGTIDQLFVKSTTTQPATGTFVIMIRKNNANTTLTVTISAGAVAGTFTDNTHSFSVSANDSIYFQGTNNATGASASFTSISVRYTPN